MFNFWRKNKKENSIPIGPRTVKKLTIFLSSPPSQPSEKSKTIYIFSNWTTLEFRMYSKSIVWYETIEFKEQEQLIDSINNIQEFVDKFLSKYEITKKCERGVDHRISYRIPDDIGYVRCKMGHWHNQRDKV